jgi:hypothetical protein
MHVEIIETQAPRAGAVPNRRRASRGIRRAVRRRGIERLFHFTRVENLPSIRAHGLLSRKQLAERGIEALVNDHDRHDGHLDRISLSIGFPNTRLLQAWRAIHPSARWAVLVLRPVVLWHHDCLFCPGNAASRRFRAMAPEQLRGLAAFQRLFKRVVSDDVPTRRRDWPTDVQAEVLAGGTIDPSLIDCIYFERPSVMSGCRSTLPPALLRANPRYFGARS